MQQQGGTCAGVADEQHVHLAADVGAAVVGARHAADQHEQAGQLDGGQAVKLGAHAAAQGTCISARKSPSFLS